MLFLLISLVLAEVPAGWDLIGTTNGVELARKKVEGKNVFAFRGETTTDIQVETLAAVLADESLAPEWVDMMVSSDVVKTYSDGSALLHQKYDVPWPLDDRDYVFKKKLQFDSSAKKVTVTLTSVEDPLAPPASGYIRAEGERTFWSFQAIDGGKTKIIVEVMTDPKGAMPDWLVNSVQEDWPHKSINALINYAKDNSPTPHPKCDGWQ